MIAAMRNIGLDYIFDEIGRTDHGKLPFDWYQYIRKNEPEILFPYLLEASEVIERVFIIEPTANLSVCSMTIKEMDKETAKAVPFMRPSGSQSAQVGPVFKRSYQKKGGLDSFSPSPKILNTTINSFEEIGRSDKAYSSYFKEIISILSRPILILPDMTEISWKLEGFGSMLECAVSKIGPQKSTVFLTVRDLNNRLPGQRTDYSEYLMSEKLAGDKYFTGRIKSQDHSQCPLCGTKDVEIFPNALKGAGINFFNLDREGVFPGIDLTNAWKKFATCAGCADLLYIYKNHVLKKRGPKYNQRLFSARIAGESALVIPYTNINCDDRSELLYTVKKFVENTGDDVEAYEDELLDLLKNCNSVLNLNFLWADIGQNIENVSGVITDVPPGRLKELSKINASFEEIKHPAFSELPHRVDGQFDFEINLSLKGLKSLFFKPGGARSKQANNARQLFQLKRNIAAAVYHNRHLPETLLWKEILSTGQYYLNKCIANGSGYELINEGNSKKRHYLTAAGWIRNLARWIFYFKSLEVMEMTNFDYQPEMEELRPFFGPETGIDSLSKAFGFTLGVLYGKLLEVQGARHVNVGANALTWLKRLTLKGKDLPELYIKTRQKLLSYEVEKSAKVRSLLTEIGKIAVQIGERIELDDIQANYYLLLGQSLSKTILKKEEVKDE